MSEFDEEEITKTRQRSIIMSMADPPTEEELDNVVRKLKIGKQQESLGCYLRWFKQLVVIVMF